MVSYQAHNLGKKVRFFFLQMYFNFFLLFLLIITYLLIMYIVSNIKINLSLSLVLLLSIFLMVNSKTNFVDLSNYKIYFIVLIIICYLPIVILNIKESPDKEALMTMVLLGSILIIMSNNLIITYLSLELQTFSLFILISSNRQSIKSNEGGLKYFILGAISSGLFLISLSVIYSITGGITVDCLNSLNNFGYNFIWKYTILLSMFFKLSLFPLHFWIPDIYEASTNDIMALVGTLPKISIIGFVIQLNLFPNFIIWCTIGSIVVGTLGAINQSKLKRLLAYSGISHIGLGLLTLSMFIRTGVEPTIVYITIYVIGFLSIILLLSIYQSKSLVYIYDLSGISKLSIILSLTCSLLLLSMGGLPPLSGFLIKWWIIWSMMINEYILVGFICILFSATGLIYYLRVTKICYFQKSSSYLVWENLFKCNKYETLTDVYLGVGLFLSCFLIFNPKLIISLTDLNLISFF